MISWCVEFSIDLTDKIYSSGALKQSLRNHGVNSRKIRKIEKPHLIQNVKENFVIAFEVTIPASFKLAFKQCNGMCQSMAH